VNLSQICETPNYSRVIFSAAAHYSFPDSDKDIFGPTANGQNPMALMQRVKSVTGSSAYGKKKSAERNKSGFGFV